MYLVPLYMFAFSWLRYTVLPTVTVTFTFIRSGMHTLRYPGCGYVTHVHRYILLPWFWYMYILYTPNTIGIR